MQPEDKELWVRMFREEYMLRVGIDWEDSDADAFYRFYGDTPHEAVMRQIEKYGLTDLTAGKTVWYVIQDEEGAYLVHDDPNTDEVLFVTTNKMDAEVALCRHCE